MATTSAHFIEIFLKKTWTICRTSQSPEVLLIRLVVLVVHHGIYYLLIHWHPYITGNHWLPICKSFLRLSFYPISDRMEKLGDSPTINETVFAFVSDITVTSIRETWQRSTEVFCFSTLGVFTATNSVCSGRTLEEDKDSSMYFHDT